MSHVEPILTRVWDVVNALKLHSQAAAGKGPEDKGEARSAPVMSHDVQVL